MSCIRVFVFLMVSAFAAAEVAVIETTSIALRGEPKYAEGFTHFDYVNPNAPKGGTLRAYTTGTFDNLNRYAQRGDFAVASEGLYDKLMGSSSDEISVYYPLIAERLEYAEDYSFIRFFINENARFTDGEPLTAEDVKFSFEKFMTQGVPFFATYYVFVEEVTVGEDNSVTFTLAEGTDREEMMALCGLTILPEHYWKDRDFSEPLREPPVGSSGVTIKDFKFGQYIIYETLDDYWAKDLPVNVGQGNFKEYRYDYYRDQTVAFEAFKAGDIDYWQENRSKEWATAYDIPAVQEGALIKEEIMHEVPQGMQGFIFNTKFELFTDIRVRQALSYMMDFEWMNKNIFYDQYTRTVSYFQGTEFMAREMPSEEELAILDPIKDQIPEAVFTSVYEPPSTDGSGNIRSNMRTALGLLQEAGWVVREQKLVNAETGEPFEFELMTYTPTAERIAIPMKENLQRIGVVMNIRQVDPSQYINRLREIDFEMVWSGYSANPYPSTALLYPWHSDYIDSTYNHANVTDPAVDYLVDGILENQTNEEALLHWGRALDRVLLWNHYVIPHWHVNMYRIAYFNKFSRPDTRPKYALGIGTWWYDEAKAAALD